MPPAILASLNKATGRKPATVSFDAAVDAFLLDATVRGLSEHTVASYRKEMKAVRKIFAGIGVDLSDIKSLTDDDYTAFVQASIAAGFQRTTINVRLRTAKIFGNFCVDKKYRMDNPAASVKSLKVRHEVGATFTRSQLKRLMSAPNIATFEGLRDLAVMRTFSDTGIRLSELTHLRTQDVILHERALNIQRTKNRYARRIPMTNRLYAILKAYLQVRGVNEYTDALFITSTDDRLSERTVQFQIKEHARKSGVLDEVQCSPHVFRRTFAKNKIRAGVDIFTLQRLMGHSDIDQLQRYVAVYATDLEDAIEKGVED